MSTEDLQRKYDRLLVKVAQMRYRQKEFSRWRASSDFERAKRLERDVDQIIEEAVKMKKSGQQEIF